MAINPNNQAKEVQMAKGRTKASLSLNQKRLVEMMQELNFGRIEGLTVRNSEPTFDPPPRIIREVKFGGENGPRRELEANDFTLKAQVLELINYITNLGNGTIECLEVKHGLPFRMNLVEVVSA
jgi:hypothetical protein